MMSMPTSDLPALHTTGTFPELAVYNHDIRINTVIGILSSFGISSVVDLGSGHGALARKMLDSDLKVDRYLGVDSWPERVTTAMSDPVLQVEGVSFIEGSMTELQSVIEEPELFRKFGAVVLLETIEHIPYEDLVRVEDGVFGHIMPEIVVVTTPDATNRLTKQQLDARGHHFEWDIPEFHDWANSVINKHPTYLASITQLTGPSFVRNTQIATFHRAQQQHAPRR